MVGVSSFSFTYPYALFLLLLIPCLIWCRVKSRELYFPKPEWLPNSVPIWERRILWIVTIFTLLVLAVANPYSYSSKMRNQRKGRDLVLALDTSGSMGERGFSREQPEATRYSIVIKLAKGFIRGRHDDNIGLVVFGTFAFTASPLTYDLKGLSEMFDMATGVGIAGTSTAIGDALFQAISTLKVGQAKSKVILLLTDGKHNAGEHSPREVVEVAKSKGIKIYTIGVGADYDKELLQTIAQATGGRSFSASNGKELKGIYESIEKLEPSPIRSNPHLNRTELAIYPLILALLLLGTLLYLDEVRK